MERAIFYAFALITVLSAGVVAFSKNLMHSAFALMATLFGVAGLYALLGADFLAAIQVLLYIGGILTLVLFGVMLTNKIRSVWVSNEATNRLGALLLIAVVGGLLHRAVHVARWPLTAGRVPEPTTADLGDLLLTRYLLPFEAISVLLLAALVGAVVIVRKELRR